MQCPQCNQDIPASVLKCICGYDFQALSKQETNSRADLQKNKRPAQKKGVSILLFVLFCWFCFGTYLLIVGFLDGRREGWLESSDYLKFVAAILLFLVLAVASLWGGIHLNTRWPNALGGVLLFFGMGNLVTLLNKILLNNMSGNTSGTSVFETADGEILIPHAFILIPAGIVLLIFQACRNKKGKIVPVLKM